MKAKKIIFTLFAFMLLAMAFTGLALAADKKVRENPVMPAPGIPQPQVFCGYCHLIAYPEIIQQGHETWRESKHGKVSCIKCHYPPQPTDDEGNPQTREKLAEGTHIPKNPPAEFSFVQIGGAIAKTRPTIVAESCTTKACHGAPESKFLTKKIQYKDNVIFRHEKHLEEELIPGGQLTCVTCHQRESEENHFEVSKAACNLCHFSNVTFNEGKAECENCHQLPKSTIKTAGGAKVNHQTIKKAGVDCASCHADIVQTTGKISRELVSEGGRLKATLKIGLGKIKLEACLNCHNSPDIVEMAEDGEGVHGIHVFDDNARCFDCHNTVTHQKAEQIETVSNECSVCHIDSHKYQRILTSGQSLHGVKGSPDPMYNARTNCVGCHTESGTTKKGHTVMKASAKSCASCHKGGQAKLLPRWKAALHMETVKTVKARKTAMSALAGKKATLTQPEYKKVNDLIQKGQDKLNTVRFGNGVHNINYSKALLESAQASFEEAARLLK